MKNNEAFEQWYCTNYWNFKKYRLPQVIFDTEKQSYNHIDVQLAWDAWRAGQNLPLVDIGV